VRVALKIDVGTALVIVAVVVLVRALSLGAQRYQRNEFDEHRRYLQTLLAKSPSIAEVEAAVGEEPIRVVTPADARSISHVWTDPRNDAAEIEAKVSKWPQTRIYRKSPMLYFIYFDSQGVMRDFSCLTS
jgi:hypothetical protein